MKIVNIKTGKAYHLDPNTQLEVERTNPFFNDVGEQTLPVTMPDSDHNREILGYPEALANKHKPSPKIVATIQDGEYFSTCRQAVLGAKPKEGIETTFYMNEGAFFGHITDARLTSVFGNETIPGISTVQQGINFCRNLLFNPDAIYAIFPVLTKGDDDEFPKWLNRLEYMKPATGDYLFYENDNENDYSYFGFYNEFDRTETVDDYTVYVSKGYYMTPFIRANYVLRRMFAHFGYTLEETFFDVTYPFTDMVFVNNTDDALANGNIRLTDLIPDMMCSTLLNVYRKKFGCEFIPDEVNRTVKIEFLKDTLSGDPSVDLSNCVDGELKITYPGQYKQLKISSKETVKNGDQYDSIAEFAATFPDAWMDASSGNYYRRSISAGITGNVSDVTELIASSAMPYMDTEKNGVEAVEVPDCAIVMKKPKYIELQNQIKTGSGLNVKYWPNKRYYGSFPHPYIGDTRALNSTVVLNDKENDQDVTEKSATAKNKEQSPMLAFAYYDTTGITFCLGTIHNYSPFYHKLSDYSLLYNGPDGIFEHFYRPYDDILRNSMHTITADLLLSHHQKLTIPAHRKVLIKNRELLINKLAFTLGGKNEPAESEFFTTHLLEPVETAMPEIDRIPIFYGYLTTSYWKINVTKSLITQSQYNASPYKGTSIPPFYLPIPDPQKFSPGYVFAEKMLASTYVSSGTTVYVLTTVTVFI